MNQGNYATKTTWRVEDKDRSNSGGLGNVVPGLVLSDSLTCWKLLSGIDTLDLLNATIPPVFIAWFDISKENSMIFTLEEGLTVLRSTFTVYVNEFIPLLHAKLSYQYFPSLDTLKYEFRESGFLVIGRPSNPSETIMLMVRKGYYRSTGPLWHKHLKLYPWLQLFCTWKATVATVFLDADIATGKRVLRGEIRIGLCEALGIPSNTTMDHGSWTIFLGGDLTCGPVVADFRNPDLPNSFTKIGAYCRSND